MIPQVGGFRGCYPDNHRNNWRCARTVGALCPRCAKTPPTQCPRDVQLPDPRSPRTAARPLVTTAPVYEAHGPAPPTRPHHRPPSGPDIQEVTPPPPPRPLPSRPHPLCANFVRFGTFGLFFYIFTPMCKHVSTWGGVGGMCILFEICQKRLAQKCWVGWGWGGDRCSHFSFDAAEVVQEMCFANLPMHPPVMDIMMVYLCRCLYITFLSTSPSVQVPKHACCEALVGGVFRSQNWARPTFKAFWTSEGPKCPKMGSTWAHFTPLCTPNGLG